jgi:hypothetical protein
MPEADALRYATASQETFYEHLKNAHGLDDDAITVKTEHWSQRPNTFLVWLVSSSSISQREVWMLGQNASAILMIIS